MAKPTSPTTALTSSLELAATCSEVRTCQAMGMAIHPAGRFLSWSRLPPTAAVDHVQPLSMRTASPPLHISESSVRPRDPRMAPYSAAATAMHRTLSTIAIQKTFLEIRPVGGVTRALNPSHNGFPVRLTVALAGLSDGTSSSLAPALLLGSVSSSSSWGGSAQSCCPQRRGLPSFSAFFAPPGWTLEQLVHHLDQAVHVRMEVAPAIHAERLDETRDCARRQGGSRAPASSCRQSARE